jgi:hypothetical protein
MRGRKPMGKIFLLLICFIFLEMKAMNVDKKKVETAQALEDLCELSDAYIFFKFLQNANRDFYNDKKKCCLKKNLSKNRKKVKLRVTFRLENQVK